MRRSWTILVTGIIALMALQPVHSMRAPIGAREQARAGSADASPSPERSAVKPRGASPTAAKVPITRSTLIDMAARLKSLVPARAAKQTVPSGNLSTLRAALSNPARKPIDVQALRAATRTGRQQRNASAPRGWDVRWNEANGTPVHITSTGPLSANSRLSASATAPERALEFFAANSGLFKLDDPYTELVPAAVIDEDDGRSHIQFDQYYKGTPVWAQSLVIHTDVDGRVQRINARYCPTPSELDLTARRISADEAIAAAATDLSSRTAIRPLTKLTARLSRYEGPSADLYVWIDPESNKPHLVWHVQIRPNVRDWWYYFVDAQTGAILEKYNNTQFDGPTTGNGTDLLGQSRVLNVYDISSDYYMIDASRSIWQATQPNILNDPKGALWTIDLRGEPKGGPMYHVVSDNNTWTDPVSVSAHYNVGEVFEYFQNTHGRSSIDNQGGTVISVIHVADADGTAYDGASWNGWSINYGDGQNAFTPLAKSLDVAAHEMAHGVTQNTVNLEYKFQSGALNESFSDVYGVLVDNDDWRLGEGVVVPAYFPSGALRDMADPHNGGTGPNDNGWQPANMNEYQNLTFDVDNGGVHVNSGIPNKAAYLIGNELGRAKLGAIYYRVEQMRFLNSQSNFCDMRAAAIQSATDLYGGGSVEVAAVGNAFDAVGILASCGGQLPPDDPPTPTGDEWIVAANQTPDNSIYLARPVIDSQDDIVQLTTTEVNTGTGKPLDVGYSDGEAVILFVDSDFNIRAIAPNPGNPQEEVIGPQGVWWSIAVSQDFGKVAVTKADPDSMIHILDLIDPGQSKSIHLYSPSTQPGLGSYTTLYSDVMDWDPFGEYILYDAYNQIPLAGGGTIDYWEINALLVEEEAIIRLFAPQPEGVYFANPSFAQSSSTVFAFDIIDIDQCTDDIAATDLYTGDGAIIGSNGCAPGGFPNVGFPHYSPDGSGMVIQWINQSEQKTVWKIPINPANLMQSTGPAVEHLIEAQLPVWLATEILSDVEHDDNGSTIPRAFALNQNFPNPFNASTIIEYETAAWGTSTLEIFNILGQRVVKFEQQGVAPGRHSFSWDGTDESGTPLASGVYPYRVTAGGNSQSRKMVLIR